MIYYVDNINGKAEFDGKSAQTPCQDYKKLNLNPGDSLLFKRGSRYNESLVLTAGEDGSPITYGAWGEGEKPAFFGGTDVSNPEDWELSATENVWICVKNTYGNLANIILNGNEHHSVLRWTLDTLTSQGDFFDERFCDNYFRKKRPDSSPSASHIYMYSVGNPGCVYNSIVAVDYKMHNACYIRDNVIIDGLYFANSLHGIAGNGGKNVIIRNCHLENIGGFVWNYDLKIRFGNAIEFWNTAENVLIENCLFSEIYDSCITHQGPGTATHPAVNFKVRNCIFENYGMAAFEYRDKMPIASEFTGNICRGAGVGFATADGELPRRSEIWPQPMGHHIFLWRMDAATDGADLLIADNDFESAPVGAAVYSIISPEAEAQITLKNNRYTRSDTLLVRFGGENFRDLETYKQKCEQDEGSRYID